MAAEVMREIGIDISAHRSKSVREILNRPVETVVTPVAWRAGMSEERKRTERDNLELRWGQIRHLPVAGAVPVEEVEQMVRAAGLADVRLIPRTDYVEALEQFEDPLYRKVAEHLPPGTRMADYLVSLTITARKPAGE